MNTPRPAPARQACPTSAGLAGRLDLSRLLTGPSPAVYFPALCLVCLPVSSCGCAVLDSIDGLPFSLAPYLSHRHPRTLLLCHHPARHFSSLPAVRPLLIKNTLAPPTATYLNLFDAAALLFLATRFPKDLQRSAADASRVPLLDSGGKQVGSAIHQRRERRLGTTDGRIAAIALSS